MRIERRHTTQGQSPYAGIDFRLTTSEIRNPDGSVVFKMDNVEVPTEWSQVASDVLAQKYFRKAGVAARLKKVEEESVPSFLWRSVPDTEALAALPEKERYVSELSSKQVFDRLAGCWTYWGWKGGYFTSDEDAQTFYDELRYMLTKQMVAPLSWTSSSPDVLVSAPWQVTVISSYRPISKQRISSTQYGSSP